MALQLVPIVEKAIELVYELQFDYTRMNEVMIICKQFGCTVIGQEQQLFCLLKIGIPKARLEEVLFKLHDLHTVDVKMVK
jgi:putative IMPACT (imprinted ancient) family translation regulator